MHDGRKPTERLTDNGGGAFTISGVGQEAESEPVGEEGGVSLNFVGARLEPRSPRSSAARRKTKRPRSDAVLWFSDHARDCPCSRCTGVVCCGMRWFAVVCLALISGCTFNEISGRWNVGGVGGCQVGHEVQVEIRDGGETYFRKTYDCGEREFSGGVPSSVERFWIQLDEFKDDGGPYMGYGSVTIEVDHVTDDFSIGLVLFQP